jgi:hypothetical protein
MAGCRGVFTGGATGAVEEADTVKIDDDTAGLDASERGCTGVERGRVLGGGAS